MSTTLPKITPRPTNVTRFLSLVGPPDPATGCRVWLGTHSGPAEPLWRERDRQVSAQRVALALHTGQATPGGAWVVRVPACPTLGCVEPTHLRAGGRPRGPRGEQAPGAVLTEAVVLAARAEYAASGSDGDGCPTIAARYGVSEAALVGAIHGRTWAHLPGAVPVGTRRHGAPAGEKSHLSFLRTEEAQAIRDAYDAGDAVVLIAAAHQVSKSTVRKIGARSRWAHLPERTPVRTRV